MVDPSIPGKPERKIRQGARPAVPGPDPGPQVVIFFNNMPRGDDEKIPAAFQKKGRAVQNGTSFVVAFQMIPCCVRQLNDGPFKRAV